MGISTGRLTTVAVLLSASRFEPAVAAQAPGFVGVYHPATGVVADGTPAWDVGSWGTVAFENSPGDGGLSFRENMETSCNRHDVNSVYGMVIAASEGGTFNNPKDTDLWQPFNLTRRGQRPGPLGATGMLQGAARFSALARTFCPQIDGIVIDDFWSNYKGGGPPEPPAPPTPPGPPGQCSTCPNDKPYQYGSAEAGFFCCTWKKGLPSHCSSAEPDENRISHLEDGTPGGCCLCPAKYGTAGCQHDTRCGNNPSNYTPCHSNTPAPPPNPSPPGRQKLGYEHMADIKAALQGKTLFPNGTVDHSSTALTPHLKLFVVTYQEQISELSSALVQDGVVDGASLWISGPSQRHISSELSLLVTQARQKVPASFPIFTGGYVTYSSIGWTEPAPFYNLLEQSVDLYDRNLIQGYYVFAGSVLSSMNASLWESWDMEAKLSASYFPWQGSATISVLDTNENPVSGAIAVVQYNSTTHVTRKHTDSHGKFSFGGWTGKARPAAHTVVVSAPGYEQGSATVQLKATGQPIQLALHLQRQELVAS